MFQIFIAMRQKLRNCKLPTILIQENDKEVEKMVTHTHKNKTIIPPNILKDSFIFPKNLCLSLTYLHLLFLPLLGQQTVPWHC